MFGSNKKATHVMGTGQGQIAVYGKKDLKARQDAAKKAGTKEPVRKVKRNER